ncbi:MAG: hypothetical protein KG028_13675 [Actinobacteria bacterium]|jgi:hypothetical protein|nr:hypothetical protein [Actinomycetota bacterium]
MTDLRPTDLQVRADIYKIAKAYLETERGLRPPEHLERFLTPAEYRRHRKQPVDTRIRTGETVLPTDVGRIHLDRHLPGQITATITTRETDDRWGALVLHFARDHAGRWGIDQLERLTRPSIARQQTRQPAGHADLDEQIGRVEGERRLVDSALRATRTRLTELRRAAAPATATDRDTIRQLRDQQRTWKHRRQELDEELTELRQLRDLRRDLADVDLRHEVHPTELDGGQLEKLLGPIPDDDWRQGLRNGVIDEIHTYRRRWNVTDARSVLGPVPDDADHQHDRDELAQTLRAAAKALGTHRRQSPARDGVDRQADHAQSRGPER